MANLNPGQNAIDEGGLRAPPGLTGWRKAWWWFDFIVLVKLARLRFIAVLIVIGLIITQWDLLVAYYDKWTRPSASADTAHGDFEWFCPMHPTVIRENGKEKCPICFMPLSKRKKGEAQQETLPAGVVNRVQLSPYRVVLGGVQTWELDYQPLFKEIKAVGFIEFNERGQRTVSARIAGRIDQLFVNETGKIVEAGDPLASIYSPDLAVTVQNLVDARRSGNEKNVDSARRRLELLGIDDAQIDELLTATDARTDLTIRSPIGGHVIKKYVREGQYVDQGTPLHEVADLSTVWIQAQIYEDDMEFLPLDQQHPGQLNEENGVHITATARSFPNEVFHGVLNFVYPHVDQSTRTLTVRCEIDNPGHKLRPGATATVLLKVFPKNLPNYVSAKANDPEQAEMLRHGEMLAVPESAVIDTGAQMIVYRETTPGTFEGVLVKLGPRMSGANGESLFPVLEGLARGDRIVAMGSFLVDAETRLNPAAGSIYFGGSGSKSAPSSVRTVRPSTPDDETAKIAAAMAHLSADDQRLAAAQGYCPILEDNRLGVMGTPVKLTIDGQAVFLCCDGCKKSALADPVKTISKVTRLIAQRRSGADPATPANATPPQEDDEASVEAELSKLSADERELARLQKFCVVLPDKRRGAMGPPRKIMVNGVAAFVCCEGCQEEALANPEKTLVQLRQLRAESKSPLASPGRVDQSSESTAEEAEIAANLAKLSAEDQKIAAAQRFCVVLQENRLGSMGPPIKLMLDGQPVFLCCTGCKKKAVADPKAAIATAARLKAQTVDRYRVDQKGSDPNHD